MYPTGIRTGASRSHHSRSLSGDKIVLSRFGVNGRSRSRPETTRTETHLGIEAAAAKGRTVSSPRYRQHTFSSQQKIRTRVVCKEAPSSRRREQRPARSTASRGRNNPNTKYEAEDVSTINERGQYPTGYETLDTLARPSSFDTLYVQQPRNARPSMKLDPPVPQDPQGIKNSSDLDKSSDGPEKESSGPSSFMITGPLFESQELPAAGQSHIQGGVTRVLKFFRRASTLSAIFSGAAVLVGSVFTNKKT